MRRVVEQESNLLSRFRTYLPHEKGYILSRTEYYLRKIQNIPDILQDFPEIQSLLPIQKANTLRYFAFLLAIHDYETTLKELEYREKDVKLSQLKDQRVVNIAKALKKESRRGRKPQKRLKLEKLKGEILRLRKEGLGSDTLIKYLWRMHRLRISKPYLLRILKEWDRQP